MTQRRDCKAQIADWFSSNKYITLDYDRGILVVPFDKGVTPEMLMEECGIGAWFADNGFNVDIKVADFEYKTQGRLGVRTVGRASRVAYLRNRTIMTVTERQEV